MAEPDPLYEIVELFSETLSEEELDELKSTIEAGEPIDLGSGNDDLGVFAEAMTGADVPPIVIHGGSGSDTLYVEFLEGAVELYGDSGSDLLEAMALSIEIHGGSGNDTIYAEGGTVVAKGGSGNDFLEVLSSDFFAETDPTLYGNGGNDVLYVDTGDGKMFGGGGRDLLSGFDGDDTMTGGSGGDEFLADYSFGASQGVPFLGDDVVTDLKLGQDEISFSTVTEEQIAYFLAEITIGQDGDDTLIDWGEDPDGNILGTMRLLGIDVDDFSVDDIHFFVAAS